MAGTEADTDADTVTLPGVPFELTPSPAEAWRMDAGAGDPEGTTVVVEAGPRTDWFVDPGAGDEGAPSSLDAPTLLGTPPEGDWQLSARVRVRFGATFDAGVVMLWADDAHWAKLCFERSPAGEDMVVSVVTREVSDDANSFVVGGDEVRLRVSRLGAAFAFHASADGATWQLVRYFTLGATASPVLVGLEGQSPTGEGCRVSFDEVRFVPQRLGDLRDGS